MSDAGSPAEGHVCDYVEPDGTTAGACHLPGPHGGRCPLCSQAAVDCPHTLRVGACDADTCVVHPWVARVVRVKPGAQNTITGEVHGIAIQADDIIGGISLGD